MNSFQSSFLESLTFPQSILKTIRLIGEYTGREQLYQNQIPQELRKLQHVAIIQSTESSNRIEGITAPLKRIKDLVGEKTTPQNRSEQEIIGYRDVLNTIHANSNNIRLNPNIIRQFHRDLFQYTAIDGGYWKTSDNTIEELDANGKRIVRFQPIPAWQTAEAMERLHISYKSILQSGKADSLVVISAYILDFLCIHPFLDGNGRMARLLTLLMLYQNGLQVGRFISLEKLIEDSRESYYSALYHSSQGWHEGQHNVIPWLEYFLGIILKAYREFEARVGTLTGGKGAKTEMILHAIKTMPGDFSVSDISEKCPTVSLDMIRHVLRQQRDEGKVECLGRGKAAKWRMV